MSVKVGVRVRPFNKRQQQLGCRACVQMEGQTTHLIDSNGATKSFVFDYSFWSHDKFMVDADGVFIPVDDKYADQQKVYHEIGSSILLNAWEGYNCCLFAYGQTGSGKSYSMLGYGENKGIIPIVCDQIFKKIHGNKDETRSFEVKVSMSEIYNENIRDLLAKNKGKQLKICEDKTVGVYVKGLQRHSVNNYDEIAKKIEEGSNSRSIAATLMNESSSRSHTIVSVIFVQKIKINPSKTSIKYSTIHLVDLAGSECVGKTGVDSKDRLRETAKINQSLSTLGRVIEILADNCSKKDKQFVPYRDSKLTYILKNALGGNSRTAMICAISPADDNFEETLSTLRYASRAKNIETKAVVNESDVDKLIRMLREENAMLKKMLQEAKFTKVVINQEVLDNASQMQKNFQEFGITSNETGEDEQLLEDSWIEDEKDTSAFCESIFFEEGIGSVDENFPYITNLSEDEQLSHRIKYPCMNLLVGTKNGNPKPNVVLSVLGVEPNHSRLFIEDSKVFIEALSEAASHYIYINGQQVEYGTPAMLFHCDRLVFGTGCVFIVVINGEKPRNSSIILPDIKEIDYQFAIIEMQEVTENQSRFMDASERSRSSTIDEEKLRKEILNEIQLERESNRKQADEKLKQFLEEKETAYNERIAVLEKERNAETARLQTQLQSSQTYYQKLMKEKEDMENEKLELMVLQKGLADMRSQEAETHQEQLEKAKQAEGELEKKLNQIAALESKISETAAISKQKEKILLHEMESEKEQMRKELEMSTIICHNENIINEYKLELNKKNKKAEEIKHLFLKRSKAEVQKQLVQLVPMLERFILMAKEMKIRIDAGLSIKYVYISEAEAVEMMKNHTYKNKIEILIHVINIQEHRSYYWSVPTFKNRAELAVDRFEAYLKSSNPQNDPKLNDKTLDPYWDPESFQVVGQAYLSLECLLYGLSYQGCLNILQKGKVIGQMDIVIEPTDYLGHQLSKLDNSMKILNPRDLIEKNLYFSFKVTRVMLQRYDDYREIKLIYRLLQQSFKLVNHESIAVRAGDLSKFTYSKLHMVKDLSETTIFSLIDKPMTIAIEAIAEPSQSDQLTTRNQSPASSPRVNETTAEKLSLSNIEVKNFTLNSPGKKESKKPSKGIIVDNQEIVSKIQQQYFRKKLQEEASNRKKNSLSTKEDVKSKAKQKDCQIY